MAETQTFEARWTWAQIPILQFIWYVVLSKPFFSDARND